MRELKKNLNSILILGGAGFIGSNLASKYINLGHYVTIIDGLLNQTGASRENLNQLNNKATIIFDDIQNVTHLNQIIDDHEIIIDCMGWTSHNLAFMNPIYDVELNIKSHLHLISALKNFKDKKLIYLGSKSQYGNSDSDLISEDDLLSPNDVHGINKLCAENYFKYYSTKYDFKIISLRIPNTFGINQKKSGVDIGLIGTFIEFSINNQETVVYGSHRLRSILYVDDLVEIIIKLDFNKINNFKAININGKSILISDLAEKINFISGKGKLKILPVPDEIKQNDMSNSALDESELYKNIGEFNHTDLNISLAKTINYFMT